MAIGIAAGLALAQPLLKGVSSGFGSRRRNARDAEQSNRLVLALVRRASGFGAPESLAEKQLGKGLTQSLSAGAAAANSSRGGPLQQLLAAKQAQRLGADQRADTNSRLATLRLQEQQAAQQQLQSMLGQRSNERFQQAGLDAGRRQERRQAIGGFTGALSGVLGQLGGSVGG